MDSEKVLRIRTHQPCAACKMLRRRCDNNCTLAPYFPTDEIEKFACVHKVFGASNVIKMIQMVEEIKREDAVKALVYEAKARLRDPVYGSAGATSHLYKMVQDLKVELESMQTQIVALQEQRNQLLSILMNVHHQDPVYSINDSTIDCGNFSVDDGSLAYDPVNFPVACDRIFGADKNKNSTWIAARKIFPEKLHDIFFPETIVNKLGDNSKLSAFQSLLG